MLAFRRISLGRLMLEGFKKSWGSTCSDVQHRGLPALVLGSAAVLIQSPGTKLADFVW